MLAERRWRAECEDGLLSQTLPPAELSLRDTKQRLVLKHPDDDDDDVYLLIDILCILLHTSSIVAQRKRNPQTPNLLLS